MSNNASTALKSRQKSQDSAPTATDTIVADLQCRGYGGWDARDVLAGRLDDATVRQAVEAQR